MESHLRAELVVDVLQVAVSRRKPAAGLLHHSDQAVHYASLSSSRRLREVGLQPSVGRTGSALDNAMVASFVSTFKAELVSRMSFPSRQGRQECHLRVSGVFYNTRWLHSALGYKSPVDFEEVEWETLSSHKVNVSVLAGDSRPRPLSGVGFRCRVGVFEGSPFDSSSQLTN